MRKIMLKSLLHAIFPSYCLLCAHNTKRPEQICIQCESLLPWIQISCIQCAAPIIKSDITYCGSCLSNPSDIDHTTCIFTYTQPIRHWVKLYKYHDQLHFKRLFSYWMAKTTNHRRNNIDLIIPVPIHTKKQRQRGYNQCDLIGKEIASKLNIEYSRNTLIKNINTPPQTSLKKKERERNIHNSFSVKKDINQLRIAVVEDVITTGSTIRSISKILKKNGAARVEIWAIARTQEQ